MTTTSPVVLVDRREPASRIKQIEDEGFTVECPSDFLESGDVVLPLHNLTVGIEIKTTSELVGLIPASLSSLAQFQRMATFDHRVLLIVGTFGVHAGGKVLLDGYNKRCGLSYAAVQGALANLQSHLGFIIRHAENEKAIGSNIRNIYKFHTTDHVLLSKPRPLHLSVASASAISVLMTLPGIGSVQAQRLLQQYKSIANVITHIEHWEEVDGIGPLTRDGCKAFLRQEWDV